MHYQSESFDGGETWSALVPSNIHATLTMPTLFRLSGGRILLFWCNTQPLPELDHQTQWPPLNEGEISGERGEDVFTNRDANHAAISEDGGRTWIGFRELALNPLRNAADFPGAGAAMRKAWTRASINFRQWSCPMARCCCATDSIRPAAVC